MTPLSEYVLLGGQVARTVVAFQHWGMESRGAYFAAPFTFQREK
jgi:hypothetical protein